LLNRNKWHEVPYIPLLFAIFGFSGIVIIAALQVNLKEKDFAAALYTLTPTVASMAIILSIILVFAIVCAEEQLNEFNRNLNNLRECSNAEKDAECFAQAIDALIPFDHSFGQSFLSIAGVASFVLHLIIGFNCLFFALSAYHGPWPEIFYPLSAYIALAMTGLIGLWLIVRKLEQIAKTLTRLVAPLTPEHAAAEGWNRYTDGGRLLGQSGFSYQITKGTLETKTRMRNFWHCLYIGKKEDVYHCPIFIALIPCAEKALPPLFLNIGLDGHSFGFAPRLKMPNEVMLTALQAPNNPNIAYKCSFLLSPESIERLYTINMEPRRVNNETINLIKASENAGINLHPPWMENILEFLPAPDARIALWSFEPAGIDSGNFIRGMRRSLERSALLLPERAGLYAAWQNNAPNEKPKNNI